VNHRRGVVLRAGTLARRVRHDGRPQLVVGVQIGAPDTFVDHGFEVARRLEANAHAHLDEHHHDPGVLADRTMALGTQA
jgi:hypothetical protein